MFKAVLIYIPHWLDSMGIQKAMAVKAAFIYIPHWLDSMGLFPLAR